MVELGGKRWVVWVLPLGMTFSIALTNTVPFNVRGVVTLFFISFALYAAVYVGLTRPLGLHDQKDAGLEMANVVIGSQREVIDRLVLEQAPSKATHIHWPIEVPSIEGVIVATTCSDVWCPTWEDGVEESKGFWDEQDGVTYRVEHRGNTLMARTIDDPTPKVWNATPSVPLMLSVEEEPVVKNRDGVPGRLFEQGQEVCGLCYEQVGAHHHATRGHFGRIHDA